jgi:steroid 5-alpha reductase family enzyme
MMIPWELFGWLLLAAIVYMIIWYIIGLARGRSDVVDSAWGLGFVMIAWLALVFTGTYRDVASLAAIFVSVWGLRLFGHIANRNWRKSSDDPRYQQLKAKYGKNWKIKMFTNVYLVQAILLVLISSSAVAVISSTSVLHLPLAVAGFIIWGFGIVYEATADAQLQHFIKTRKKGKGDIMTSGLWRYSRHPNYFGEITSWWGCAIVALSLHEYWGVIGAIIITILVTKVSGVPLLEKHYASNKAYQAYKNRTSSLLPLPPEKN